MSQMTNIAYRSVWEPVLAPAFLFFFFPPLTFSFHSFQHGRLWGPLREFQMFRVWNLGKRPRRRSRWERPFGGSEGAAVVWSKSRNDCAGLRRRGGNALRVPASTRLHKQKCHFPWQLLSLIFGRWKALGWVFPSIFILVLYKFPPPTPFPFH